MRRMSMGLVAIEVEVNPRGLVVVVEWERETNEG